MKATNEELACIARIMAAEWLCEFCALDNQAGNLDAWVDLGVLLCEALPDEDKAALRTHLLARWAGKPPAWAAPILEALQGAPIGGLDMDVWGELLDNLPDN